MRLTVSVFSMLIIYLSRVTRLNLVKGCILGAGGMCWTPTPHETAGLGWGQIRLVRAVSHPLLVARLVLSRLVVS